MPQPETQEQHPSLCFHSKKKKKVNVKQQLYVTHVYVNTAREEKRKCFE